MRQRLFDYLAQDHRIHALESELEEIIRIVLEENPMSNLLTKSWTRDELIACARRQVMERYGAIMKENPDLYHTRLGLVVDMVTEIFDSGDRVFNRPPELNEEIRRVLFNDPSTLARTIVSICRKTTRGPGGEMRFDLSDRDTAALVEAELDFIVRLRTRELQDIITRTAAFAFGDVTEYDPSKLPEAVRELVGRQRPQVRQNAGLDDPVPSAASAVSAEFIEIKSGPPEAWFACSIGKVFKIIREDDDYYYVYIHDGDDQESRVPKTCAEKTDVPF